MPQLWERTGTGQWAEGSGQQPRALVRETRASEPADGGQGLVRAWAVGSPIPGPDQTLHQPAHSTQHTGRRSWGVALQPHPRGGGEESNGITSAVVWWALNGREMVTVVVDSQLLHWACLHKLAHA
jgi:hypothetical protein